MKILLACEESQTVCMEFRKKGHEAYSCDTEPASGPHPEWHIQDDVLKHLNDGWDMMIAFPPCTHLAVSGAKHFDKKRADGRQREAIEFFMKLWQAPIKIKGLENPVNIITGGDYIKQWFPDLAEKYELPLNSSQRIQPWQFGDPFQKTTLLWLKGLPPLFPTQIVSKGEFVTAPSGKKLPKWYSQASGNSKIRSKTFPGIAKAMAQQWG